AGSSAATIIIFTPLAFLSGVTGAFFKALSLTMAASLIISFVVAWLAVPILCATFLKKRDAEIEEHGRFARRVHGVYREKMVLLLRQPRFVIVFFVRLKPFPRRGIEEVMNDVRDEIEKHIPGLQVELLQLMEDLIGDLTSVPQPIEIKLYSDDEQLLRTLPPRVADTISKVRGVVEVKNGIVPA